MRTNRQESDSDAMPQGELLQRVPRRPKSRKRRATTAEHLDGMGEEGEHAAPCILGVGKFIAPRLASLCRTKPTDCLSMLTYLRVVAG